MARTCHPTPSHLHLVAGMQKTVGEGLHLLRGQLRPLVEPKLK